MKLVSFSTPRATTEITLEEFWTDAIGRPYRSMVKTFKDPDILPVEGVVISLKHRDDRTYVVCLMSDDHAARLAVSDEAHGIEWE